MKHVKVWLIARGLLAAGAVMVTAGPLNPPAGDIQDAERGGAADPRAVAAGGFLGAVHRQPGGVVLPDGEHRRGFREERDPGDGQ